MWQSPNQNTGIYQNIVWQQTEVELTLSKIIIATFIPSRSTALTLRNQPQQKTKGTFEIS